MRLVMIGAGAIGGITAAYMAKAGLDITLVCKHPEVTDLANGAGLTILGLKGEEQIPVQAVTKVSELSGEFDVCMIATKAYDMPEAAREILPFLKADSLVVSMQNGICTDALAEIVGAGRTVGCVIGWGATMHQPGRLEMTSEGEFILGIPGQTETGALEPLRKAMETVVPTKTSGAILSELYSKLIVNSCITSLGAICGLRLGEMMKRKQARKIFLAIIQEAMEVAHGLKLPVFPFGGRLDYEKLIQGKNVFAEWKRHLMIRIVGIKYKNLKSSSLQSLERGRPTEIDYFNGYIVKKGREVKVDCPVNARLTQMVKEIERGERKITEQNLFDAAFRSL